MGSAIFSDFIILKQNEIFSRISVQSVLTTPNEAHLSNDCCISLHRVLYQCDGDYKCKWESTWSGDP